MNHMNNKIDNERLEYLYRGILTLETVEDCRCFFEDLCTPSELLEMSRRMQAAKMLKNNMVYTDISAETGLSTATISRVNRCIKFNDGGYVKVIEDLERVYRKK